MGTGYHSARSRACGGSPALALMARSTRSCPPPARLAAPVRSSSRASGAPASDFEGYDPEPRRNTGLDENNRVPVARRPDASRDVMQIAAIADPPEQGEARRIPASAVMVSPNAGQPRQRRWTLAPAPVRSVERTCPSMWNPFAAGSAVLPIDHWVGTARLAPSTPDAELPRGTRAMARTSVEAGTPLVQGANL